MSNEINLPNGKRIVFESSESIIIGMTGPDTEDFQSIKFNGIREKLLDSDNNQVYDIPSSQLSDGVIISASSLMTPDENGNTVITIAEMNTISAIFKKIFNQNSAVISATQNKITQLNAAGASL